MHIAIKRIYDDPTDDDGTRVLIDRLWPRGISKGDARIDHWAKDIAPSDELRQWFDHDAGKFDRFADRYRDELDNHREQVDALLDRIDRRKRLTLLTATKDPENSHALVLKRFLEHH